MRNDPILILTLFLSFIFIGCSSNLPQNDPTPNNRNVTLNDIENLRIGSTTREDTKKLFGAPNREVNLDKHGGGIGWAYKIKDGPEFSLTFDPANVLVASLWSPLSEKPEASLQGALTRFPKGHFTPIKRQWTAADGIYEQTTYSDKNLGIDIELWNYSDSRVESISFTRPQENIQRLPSQK